jgi:hypothetical protein
MMRDRRVRVRLVAGAVAASVAMTMLIGASAAGAATEAGAARWRLVDYQQAGCFSPNVHDTYFGVYIQGRWRTAIDVGASGLPAGGTYDTTYAPIPPGQSAGEFTLAYVHVTLPSSTPLGSYTGSMWANDGSVTRQVPIVMNVQDRCGY